MFAAASFFFFVLFSLCAFAATPYKPGEKTSFAITYFGATAGILDVEVLSATELNATARTDSIFSLFYRLKNSYRSTVDAISQLPSKFVTTHDETKQEGLITQEFDQKKKSMKHSDRRLDHKKGKIEKDFSKEIPAGTHDVVSSMFSLRMLPLEKGKKFEIPVFIGEEVCLLRIEVDSEEELSTKIGTFSTWVLKPSLLKDGQVKDIPETFVWISKDKNRAMLKVKAKVKIGSVVAYLRSYEPGK